MGLRKFKINPNTRQYWSITVKADNINMRGKSSWQMMLMTSIYTSLSTDSVVLII